MGSTPYAPHFHGELHPSPVAPPQNPTALRLKLELPGSWLLLVNISESCQIYEFLTIFFATNFDKKIFWIFYHLEKKNPKLFFVQKASCFFLSLLTPTRKKISNINIFVWNYKTFFVYNYTEYFGKSLFFLFLRIWEKNVAKNRKL